jgi:hypothetical protein
MTSTGHSRQATSRHLKVDVRVEDPGVAGDLGRHVGVLRRDVEGEVIARPLPHARVRGDVHVEDGQVVGVREVDLRDPAPVQLRHVCRDTAAAAVTHRGQRKRDARKSIRVLPRLFGVGRHFSCEAYEHQGAVLPPHSPFWIRSSAGCLLFPLVGAARALSPPIPRRRIVPVPSAPLSSDMGCAPPPSPAAASPFFVSAGAVWVAYVNPRPRRQGGFETGLQWMPYLRLSSLLRSLGLRRLLRSQHPECREDLGHEERREEGVWGVAGLPPSGRRSLPWPRLPPAHHPRNRSSPNIRRGMVRDALGGLSSLPSSQLGLLSVANVPRISSSKLYNHNTLGSSNLHTADVWFDSGHVLAPFAPLHSAAAGTPSNCHPKGSTRTRKLLRNHSGPGLVGSFAMFQRSQPASPTRIALRASPRPCSSRSLHIEHTHPRYKNDKTSSTGAYFTWETPTLEALRGLDQASPGPILVQPGGHEWLTRHFSRAPITTAFRSPHCWRRAPWRPGPRPGQPRACARR